MRPLRFFAPLACALLLGAPTAHSQDAPEVPEVLEQDSVPRLEVGHRAVKAKQLRAYDASWSSSNAPDSPPIREIAEISSKDGVRLLTRTQIWPMQAPLAQHSELVIDLSDGSTKRYATWIEGLPEGAGIGGRPDYLAWDFEGASYELETRTQGESTLQKGELPAPMFDGNGLGLVLAALPLKTNYIAELPVSMALGLAPELTQYTVVARVVGREEITVGKNRTAKAWIVAVDWYDYTTRKLSSKGGRSDPGGAYFVLTKPSRGLPHVLRYENDGGTIDFVPES